MANIHNRLSKCMLMLALIAQIFAMAPAWAHPGHDAIIQHGNHDKRLEQHVHSHDHGDMKQQEASKTHKKPATDCCDSSHECNNCNVGHCSSGSAMVCSPLSMHSPASVFSINNFYQFAFVVAPVSELFRPPIQA